MNGTLRAVSGRREALYLALAAAEVCWVAAVFLGLTRATNPHPSLPVWLVMLVLMLAFFYLYRGLTATNLRIQWQQGLLVGGLLLSIGLFLRYHVYQTAGFPIVGWIVEMVREITDPLAVMPGGWVTVMALVYLWARGIQLGRRSLSPESVGLSFRAGVVILAVAALLFGLYGDENLSGFVAPYFFFALIAVALSRVEEASSLSERSQERFGGFWIGSTVVSVAVLMLMSMAVALLFYGGALRWLLRLLSPLLFLVQITLAALGVLLLMLFEAILSLFAVDLTDVGRALQEVMARLGALASDLQALSGPPGGSERSVFLAVVQFVSSMAIPIAIVILVLVLTWWRVQRSRRDRGNEVRESIFSAGALGRNLLAALQSGRDRLGQLVGLVDRFGLGTRLLSAITIRRIYINMVRLATKAGYPRLRSQTPYEYLETLHQALPGREADAALITEAYVGAHYGQVPDTAEELRRIRECWERVHAQGASPRQEHK
jgi:hypothetical protein